ncbi:zinc finger protein 710-like [Hippocampus zosterae]|uniref:zinc finger protein 710-like n=1 Tax=Hippocampus zosterae TaxID=109293 RepID=UPI00223E7207|nr:zinc finger protein 710-like [Hippocampus zosterae]
MRMRSPERRLQPHSGSDAGEDSKPTATRDRMDAETQTEPVVVLSLAQAAVLGLISQNEVFGATVAPDGFYAGDSKGDETGEYEYAHQLIGANGDYLPEPAGDRGRPSPRRPGTESCGERATRPPQAAAPPAPVKGEPTESETSAGGGCVPDADAARFPRAPAGGNCAWRAGASSLPRGPHPEESRKEEPEALNLKTDKKYAQADEAAYRSAGDYEESGRAAAWSDPEGLARRVQMDRLDINVQIDESYCVDVGEGLRRWKCRMCAKSYTSKYNLVTHILGHNGIKPHECAHCGKLFKQPSHLQTHLLTHQGARPHKCGVCDKAFTQTSHLKRHMLRHSDVKPYSCRFCARGFAYPSELRSHEGKHDDGRCRACGRRAAAADFPACGQLKRHPAGHQAAAAAYCCGECRKALAYRGQPRNHAVKRRDVRPYVCPECGMEFVQLHHLRQHALTHKGIKEFKCKVCSREFTLSANLKRHMLIHASVRPFQCHVCFKTFVQKQTLKTHMIVHLPVKPFKCKVCGKSFNRMYNLLGHMHLHAGSKPFKCPYCSSKFNLKGNLSRHTKVKHGIAEGHEPPQDAEAPRDYEEESFEFGERQDRANGNAGDAAQLSQMEYYATYAKGAAPCSTA